MFEPTNLSGSWGPLKRILDTARPYRRRLLGAVLLTLVGASIGLLLPLGIKALLDGALAHGDRQLLHSLGLGLLLLFLANAGISYLSGLMLQTAGEQVALDLRRQLYRHYQRLDLAFFQEHRLGELMSRLSNDTDSVQQTLSGLLASSVVHVFKLIGAVGLMMMLDLRLSLLVLLMAPTATLLSRIFGKILRRMSKQTHEREAESQGIANEALSAIQLVQVCGRGEHESRRYDRSLERLFEASVQEIRAQSAFLTLVGLMSVLSTIAIFWYGGGQVLAGRLQIGHIIAFLFYSQMVSQSIGGLAELYGSFNRMLGSCERIFEWLDLRPSIEDPAQPQDLRAVRGGIEMQGVSLTYGHDPSTAPVLRDISFAAAPGQTIAVVGPSGAGKSSLLRLLPRLFDATTGRVLIDGVDVRRCRVDELRSHIAVVSQEVQLFAGTIRENIRYGRLDASDAEVAAAAEAACVAPFVRRLADGYDTAVGERGVKLSGGQRQRIAIARALLSNASVLILDEATSSVDSESEAEIQGAIERLCAERTTFIAAHRLSTVKRADLILVLDGGCLVERGRHDELMARQGLYHRLVERFAFPHDDRAAGPDAEARPALQEAVA